MSLVRKLTRDEVPNGSLLFVVNDIHIGIADIPALKLGVEIAEAAGATHTIVNGDGWDCAAVSRHEGKKKKAHLDTGQLAEEIEEGRWFVDWLKTRPAIIGTGNHEAWLDGLALETGTVGTVTMRSMLGIPDAIEILEHGYQIRLGSLVIEHGDLTGKGSGGANVAQFILNKYPDQSTIVGHYHRQSVATRTAPDHDGVMRSRCAVSLGHVSLVNAHSDYAGRSPNWQQGVGFVRVWYADNKPRFTITPLEIHRDRRNRPIAEFNGRVYRG